MENTSKIKDTHPEAINELKFEDYIVLPLEKKYELANKILPYISWEVDRHGNTIATNLEFRIAYRDWARTLWFNSFERNQYRIKPEGEKWITYNMIESKIIKLIAEGAVVHELDFNGFAIGNLAVYRNTIYIKYKDIYLVYSDKTSLYEKLKKLSLEQRNLEHTQEEIIKYLESFERNQYRIKPEDEKMITYKMIESKINRLIAEGAVVHELDCYGFAIDNFAVFHNLIYIKDQLIDLDESDKKSLYEKIIKLSLEQRNLEHTVEEIIKYLES